MRLRLKYAVNVRPDSRGEYPELIGRRLIAAGLAELETTSIQVPVKRGRGRPRKVVENACA
jgi:hypothetical protein